MADWEKVISELQAEIYSAAYHGNSFKDCVPVSLLQNALSLLKAQEPRVMTLEEVKNSEVLYFEDFTDISDCVKPIVRPAVNIEVKNGGVVMLDSEMWDDGFTFSTDEEYGKTWRCWTSRPTDKQREAVKWE